MPFFQIVHVKSCYEMFYEDMDANEIMLWKIMLDEGLLYTLNEFKGKKVSVYFSNSKHSQQSFAAPRS